jgi:hypothetical protein
MANIVIDIASEFTGAKAFKQADSATQKLTNGVKKLAGAVGLAYGTTAIIAFGKASVKAAAADQKAQQQLALALKNVGLGRDAATSEAYIQRLQSEFGIVDDLLRPAYQTLAVATGNTEEAQRLLNLSLDISASTGKELTSVTAALSRAFLGNNTALSKLGVGISKADLKAKSFEEITKQLTTTFAGSATAAAGTFQGSIDKLGVASANVSEIIGTGLIDALTNLGENTSVADLASNMEKTATYLADVIRGVGVLAAKLKDIPVLGNLNVGMIPIVGSYIELLRKAGTQTADLTSADNAHLKSLNDSFKVIKKTATITKKLTADELNKLKAKQLQNALDKANIALNKGGEVFDMDKIQIAAALTSQAEQLGKATSGAQVLQIANDIARLNVKRSILALEDAIAAKDEAAIVAATNKLNADLKVLGTLGMQNVKLQDIKSILESLKPKDLINISNLEEALRLLNQIDLLSKLKIPTSASLGSGIPSGDYIAPISTAGGSIEAILEYADAAAARANAFADLLDMENASAAGSMASSIDLESIARSSLLQGLSGGAGVAGAVSGSRYAAQAANAYNITIQTGIGDPNAIAEAIDNVLREAQQRGTLTAV